MAVRSNAARRERDVRKLVTSAFNVDVDGDDLRRLIVEVSGPDDSPYAGGSWRVSVVLPDEYPYKSPSIGFLGRIFHPNVDEESGSVCLDVINQTWSPMFDLKNIFESFLPQLLLYPNAMDPLNKTAANLYNESVEAFNAYTRKHTAIHGTAGATSVGGGGNESRDDPGPLLRAAEDEAAEDEAAAERQASGNGGRRGGHQDGGGDGRPGGDRVLGASWIAPSDSTCSLSSLASLETFSEASDDGFF